MRPSQAWTWRASPSRINAARTSSGVLTGLGTPADGSWTLWGLRRHIDAIPIDARHARGGDVGRFGKGLAVKHHGVRVVGVHMSNRAGGGGGQGDPVRRPASRPCDPRHPAITPNIADMNHLQLPEREVAEVGIVGLIGMRCEECGSSAAKIPFDSRARPEDRDAAVGERISAPPSATSRDERNPAPGSWCVRPVR